MGEGIGGTGFARAGCRQHFVRSTREAFASVEAASFGRSVRHRVGLGFFSSSRARIWSASMAALLTNSPLLAQEVRSESATPAPASEIQVNGERSKGILRDAKPIIVLNEEQIASYGVGSVAALLDALKPLLKGNDAPLVLVNGKQIADFRTVRDFPIESIKNLEIYPPEQSIALGQTTVASIVNVKLKPKSTTKSASASATLFPKSWTSSEDGNANYTLVRGEKKFSVNISLVHTDQVLASQRGVEILSSSPPYSINGNILSAASSKAEIDPALSALAGEVTTIVQLPGESSGAYSLSDFVSTANSPSLTDMGPYQTLRPSSLNASLNTMASVMVGDVTVTGNVEISKQRSSSLNGLPAISLMVPDANSYSPFAGTVVVDRYVSDFGPLRSTSESLATHLGISFDGKTLGWTWLALVSRDITNSKSLAETSIDSSSLQALIDSDAQGVNPFGPINPDLLDGPGEYTAKTKSMKDVVGATMNRPIFKLKGGSAILHLHGGTTNTTTDSSSYGAISEANRSLSRRTFNLGSILVLPFSNQSKGNLGGLGDVNGEFVAQLNHVSAYGSLATFKLLLSWSPSHTISFYGSFSTKKTAPSVGSLIDADISTPNVQVYDYLKGVTSSVTSVTGGNPDLKAPNVRSVDLTISIRPLKSDDLSFYGSYSNTTINDFVSALPAPSEAIEAAFPDRYVRNVAGTLILIDARPVNFDKQNTATISASLSYRHVFNSNGGQAAKDDSSAESLRKAAPDTTLDCNLSQSWRLKDTLLIREGLPSINLLNNATPGYTNAPNYTLGISASVRRGKSGASLNFQYQPGTTVRNGSDLADLYFSDSVTAALYLYASLEGVPLFKSTSVLKGVNLSLSVPNLLGKRQTVRNGLGETPTIFSPAYLDPNGWTLAMGVRRTF